MQRRQRAGQDRTGGPKIGLPKLGQQLMDAAEILGLAFYRYLAASGVLLKSPSRSSRRPDATRA